MASPGAMSWAGGSEGLQAACASGAGGRAGAAGQVLGTRGTSLTRQGKASRVTNAQTHTGPGVPPLQCHGDFKDLLHYLSFPKTYLHIQR